MRLALRTAIAALCLLAGTGRVWSNEDCPDGPDGGAAVTADGGGINGYHGHHGSFPVGPLNYDRTTYPQQPIPYYGAKYGGYGYGQPGYEGYKPWNYLRDDRNFHRYAGPGGCRTCSAGDCQYRWYGQPDLFYNYYVPPQCGGVGAELYVSPRPVPPHVGHTFITYQPLMPHEFMYAHSRTYHRYYNGGQGLNRTSVRYLW